MTQIYVVYNLRSHLISECSPSNGYSVMDVVDVDILGGVTVEVSLQLNTRHEVSKRTHVHWFHQCSLGYLMQLKRESSK